MTVSKWGHNRLILDVPFSISYHISMWTTLRQSEPRRKNEGNLFVLL